MEYLNKILPTYNYYFFDQYNQLQSKQLNILQCLFRKLFGSSPETHLCNVVKKAYTLTLNGEFQATRKKQQALLSLFAKVERVYGLGKSFIELPDFDLPSGNKVTVAVCYALYGAPRNEQDLKISSIDFKLIFRNRDGSVHNTQELSIYKNKSNKLIVRLPHRLFAGYTDDSVGSINRRLSSEPSPTISKLVAKIVTESQSCSEMAEVQYHANDYYRLGSLSPGECNEAQAIQMEKFGWNYIGQHQELGAPSPLGRSLLNEKRIYAMNRRNVAPNNQLGLKQNLSVSFAASHLEERE